MLEAPQNVPRLVIILGKAKDVFHALRVFGRFQPLLARLGSLERTATGRVADANLGPTLLEPLQFKLIGALGVAIGAQGAGVKPNAAEAIDHRAVRPRDNLWHRQGHECAGIGQGVLRFAVVQAGSRELGQGFPAPRADLVCLMQKRLLGRKCLRPHGELQIKLIPLIP